jgi:prepilin-type N-terminal cleavage/methylation domain-containing protein
MNEKGFTLIEIIAVLVILAIMAAVAIPKYMNMQSQAAINAASGALAAGASNVSMTYANMLINGTSTANLTAANVAANSSTSLGDYTATYAAGAVGNLSVVITVTPPAGQSVPAANLTKTVVLVP